MAHIRMLTPEASPEPEVRPSGLWQPKPTTTTTNTTTAATTQHQPLQKRKRSWPFTTTRPVSPPSSTSPMRDDDDDSRSSTSVKALWEKNGGLWRTAARKGLAPFQDAHHEDLQPIFETLIDTGVDDITSPEYTLAFYPRAHELALLAENALLHHGDAAGAAALYLRASAVLRVGRYSPTPSASSSAAASALPACPVRARAWQLQKSYHLKAGRLDRESPLDEVTIPHTHDAATRPDETTAGVRERGSVAKAAGTKLAPARPQIPLVVRLPQHTLRTGTPCPAVLVVTDDRTAHSALCGDFLARGWGCVVVEAPGCGDCPVTTASSASDAAALWASVLEWMGAIRVFDMARVVVWAAAAETNAAGLTGHFAAAVGGARVRGCVAVVRGGEEAVLAADGGWGSGGRVLVVADNDGASAGAEVALLAADGLWMPATATTCDEDAEDDGLVLFEYGALGGVGAEQAVRSLAASTAAVYDWVEDLLRLDLVV